MNRKKDSRQKAKGKRPQQILVFGESENDTKSLQELIVALRGNLAGKVQTRRNPLVLIKNTKPEDVPTEAKRIADVVDISQTTHDIVAVFAHEDCDDFEPKHEGVCQKIEAAMQQAGCPAHAVVPAWELEAWWFMWPDAVQAVRPKSWRAPDDYLGKEVGRLKDAKEELQKRVVPKNLKADKRKTFQTYQESDSPAIARHVREKGLARKPGAKSGSYARFMASVDQCKVG
ncbi:hypothetical protein D7X55_36950 [Corallococcus sp. AB049A]|uniref:DUF4276 family protein n=1 Tax=Corallococcus interemptor TaxID=2316720 RepID=A0A3A8PU33_9BACT|nr:MULTISPECIES: hypothetical protein [Corallococcus]RKH59789.1 hypothetical protein D7X96_34805 [Corallococcus interemptor]RKI46922.1 hypothetical protein D7X55_36950 [Corallococcus sp. AB049A]